MFSELPYFRKVSYPLGSKASTGRWRSCATTNPWIERKLRPESISNDGSVTSCVEFDVEEEKDTELSFSETFENQISSSAETSVLDSGLTFEQHFVSLKFGDEMKKKYRPGVPISGRVRSLLDFYNCSQSC